MSRDPTRTAAEAGVDDLLRRRRRELGLSQEQLAEQAGVSVRALRDLERGCVTRPRPATTSRLADALGLSDPDRARLVGASRPRLPAEPAHCLPPDLVRLVGRDAELADVLASASGPGRSPVLVHGPAGGGTTALLVRAAHRLAARAVGPVVHLDLRDVARQRGAEEDVVSAVARHVRAALAPPGAATANDAARVPDATDPLAPLGSEGVLVLDGVRDGDDVAGLLRAGGPRLLVGSRGPLPELEGLRRVPLRPLADAAAREVMIGVLGAERLAAEPGAAAALLARCGGWPLALRLVGARAAARPGWPLAEVLTRVTGSPAAVERVRSGDVSVCAVLDDAAGGLPRDAISALAEKPDGSVAGSAWADVLVSRGLVWPDGTVAELVRDWAALRT